MYASQSRLVSRRRRVLWNSSARSSESGRRAPRPRVSQISTVRPEVVAPAAADPAVLVHNHSDLRLSLAQLASETDTELAARYVVTRLATGCVDLAPEPPASDEAASQDHPTTPSRPAAQSPHRTRTSTTTTTIASMGTR